MLRKKSSFIPFLSCTLFVLEPDKRFHSKAREREREKERARERERALS